MASNGFGQLFRITTWGESHGKAIGVVIDGCPAGVAVSEDVINAALTRRAPGRQAFTSPRQELDRAEVYSGVYEGVTTGTPISIMIPNRDADSSAYTAMQAVLRPGHAQFTYLEKYGVYDYRGGGRASARETACRVAAGAVAQQLLTMHSITVCAYLSQLGPHEASVLVSDVAALQQATWSNPLFCPDPNAAERMRQTLMHIQSEGDSVGGLVRFIITGLPTGLGDPVYEKLEANLAKAMLSIPASKGFEVGEGFRAVHMLGSAHNDQFFSGEQGVDLATNHAGGLLGGISTGMPIWGSVAFKPTSSIRKPQDSVNLSGDPQQYVLSDTARHDPCVAIRAVPVVEAMCALVVADALLLNRSASACSS